MVVTALAMIPMTIVGSQSHRLKNLAPKRGQRCIP